MMKMDGYDEAIIGTSCVWRDGGQVDVVVYSGDRIVEILCERDGMGFDEAVEFVDVNIEGAYVGVGTPVVVWEATAEEVHAIEDMYEVDDAQG